MPIDYSRQVELAQEKGERDSDRIVKECWAEIGRLLDGYKIYLDGKWCWIKVLTTDGKVMFDVKEPCQSLDHLEFTVEKTGWGMNLTTTEPTDE